MKALGSRSDSTKAGYSHQALQLAGRAQRKGLGQDGVFGIASENEVLCFKRRGKISSKKAAFNVVRLNRTGRVADGGSLGPALGRVETQGGIISQDGTRLGGGTVCPFRRQWGLPAAQRRLTAPPPTRRLLECRPVAPGVTCDPRPLPPATCPRGADPAWAWLLVLPVMLFLLSYHPGSGLPT